MGGEASCYDMPVIIGYCDMFVVGRPRASLDFVDRRGEPIRMGHSHWPRAAQTSKAASTNAEGRFGRLARRFR